MTQLVMSNVAGSVLAGIQGAIIQLHVENQVYYFRPYTGMTLGGRTVRGIIARCGTEVDPSCLNINSLHILNTTLDIIPDSAERKQNKKK